MQPSADNGVKSRLIEPLPMVKEVLRLKALGIPKDRVAAELTQRFYVDMDLLNAVMRALPRLQNALGEEEDIAARLPEIRRTAA